MPDIKELTEMLLEYEKPSEYFEKLREDGSVFSEMPELASLIGVMQNQIHHKEGDVWIHTMMVIDQAAKRRKKVKNKAGFMLAALCHDFGKPLCTQETDGVIHSYGHETAGLPAVRNFLERLGADNELADYVLNMTELHMNPNIMAGMKSKIKKTNRLFYSSAEPYALIQLAVCDCLGKIPEQNDSEDFLTERLHIFEEIMSRPFPGKAEILSAGVPDDEHFNEVLDYSVKLRLAGVNSENALVQIRSFSRTLRRKHDDCK